MGIGRLTQLCSPFLLISGIFKNNYYNFIHNYTSFYSFKYFKKIAIKSERILEKLCIKIKRKSRKELGKSFGLILY